MPLSFDAMVSGLERAGVPRDRAIDRARQELGLAPDPAESIDAAALEKQIEAAGDRLMQQLGFEVIRFSHPGKTKQTEGIPDRRYMRRPRIVERNGARWHVPAICVWAEYKTAAGRQRPGQKLFQELAEACGEHYVLGTYDALCEWLAAHELIPTPEKS